MCHIHAYACSFHLCRHKYIDGNILLQKPMGKDEHLTSYTGKSKIKHGSCTLYRRQQVWAGPFTQFLTSKSPAIFRRTSSGKSRYPQPESHEQPAY